MKEPGQDKRHRDKNGRVSEKHGNALNKNLPAPIPQFGPKVTLATMREGDEICSMFKADLQSNFHETTPTQPHNGF